MSVQPRPLSLDSAIFIIGGGLAGMLLALKLAPRRVVLVHPGEPGVGSASELSRGGIACAVGPGDDPGSHARDTHAVAAGLAPEQIVRAMTGDAVAQVPALEALGVRFDRRGGALRLGLEAAHSHPRIMSAGGDATGAHLCAAISAQVRASRHIIPLYGWRALRLHMERGQLAGLVLRAPDGALRACAASAVALATGGAGQLYAASSNPPGAQGHGLALAYEAGATLIDLEFIQFHPTGLDVAGMTKPLLTEALRGAGAQLIVEDAARVEEARDVALELASRDIVARAIHRTLARGERPMLDLRPIAGLLDERFPRALADCAAAGLDPRGEALPIVPVAHYHMGGVAAGLDGATSVKGLWALGEVACTGLHGANRLASNSLMEAVVMAGHVAASIAAATPDAPTREAPNIEMPGGVEAVRPDDELLGAVQQLMTRHVGILRDGEGLRAALAELRALEQAGYVSCEGMLILRAAQLITGAALRREESRGAHYRQDYPALDPAWAQRQRVALGDCWSVSPRA